MGEKQADIFPTHQGDFVLIEVLFMCLNKVQETSWSDWSEQKYGKGTLSLKVVPSQIIGKPSKMLAQDGQLWGIN